VTVYLPRPVAVLDTADATGAQGPESPAAARGGRELILVVDDEPAVRQFSVDALSEMGYPVLAAEGADTALALLDAHPAISLLFTDVVMPQVNGRELADEALRRRPDLRVLFATGYSRNALERDGVLDPSVQVIGKPFTLDELAARIRAVLANG